MQGCAVKSRYPLGRLSVLRAEEDGTVWSEDAKYVEQTSTELTDRPRRHTAQIGTETGKRGYEAQQANHTHTHTHLPALLQNHTYSTNELHSVIGRCRERSGSHALFRSHALFPDGKRRASSETPMPRRNWAISEQSRIAHRKKWVKTMPDSDT